MPTTALAFAIKPTELAVLGLCQTSAGSRLKHLRVEMPEAMSSPVPDFPAALADVKHRLDGSLET